MRVCLLGDFGDRRNEGMRNVAHNLADRLRERGVTVMEADTGEALSPSLYASVRTFSPDVVHYVTGIGLRNVLYTRALGALAGAETVISALHPHNQPGAGALLRYLGPSLVFTQSSAVDRDLRSRGGRTAPLPNGVDTSRFAPLPEAERRAVRETYGLPADAFVVLHVGHLTERRNVAWLADVAEDGAHVLVVSRETPAPQAHVVRELEAAGCTLVVDYIEDIERVYGAADCYAYPVQRGDSIELPLSVLEAMACDLPVVATPLCGLRDRFSDVPGVAFADSRAAFAEAVRTVRADPPGPGRRDRVAAYTWERVADEALAAYEGLLA